MIIPKSISTAFFRAFFLLGVILFLAPGAFAQSGDKFDVDAADKAANTELSFHMGHLLPNQISGMTEIIALWGMRGGLRLGDYSFAEMGFNTGSDEGVDYSNLFLSLRWNAPIEHLLGIIFIGGDIHRYKGTTGGTKTFGGAHVGGGVLAPINEVLWFRLDMKFNINPGTSLFIGGGFEFRF